MKKDTLKSVVVLTVICLVVAAAMAVANKITKPIIDGGALSEADAARIELLPEADGFTLLEMEALPAGVTEVYRANNGAGYVIMMTVTGYKSDINIACAIDQAGLIVNTKPVSHGDTPGIGDKIEGEDFISQFSGADASLTGVETISGATVSSTAYIDAIGSAFEAFEAAKEAE